MEIIEGTLIWRKLPSYDKNPKKRIVKMPRGHLKDTGLIHYFLNIHFTDDLKGHYLYGRIWEGFIIEQLLRDLERNLIKHDAYFYRTHNLSEIDLIIEGRFGLIPIEIKSGSATSKKQLRILEGFVKKNNCPYGILINNGDAVYRMTDRIIQIPAVFL